MSNYPHTIQEGVMKVPPVVERAIMDFTAKHVFWAIRDRFTAKVRAELPQHWTEFKAEMARWGVTLPRSKYPMPADGLATVRIPLDTTGMPDSYTKSPADRDAITLVLDWKGTVKSAGTTLASHRNFTKTRDDGSTYEKSYVIIFLNRARDLDRIPSKNRYPEEIGYVLRDIMANLRHELQHVVQFAMLRSRDPRQVAKVDGYSGQQSNYLLSPVEFEPQITDAIYDFTNTYRIITKATGKAPKLDVVFRSYVAATKSRIGDGFGTSELFSALKKNDRTRWKDAVRKFYVGVMAELRSSK